MISGEHNSPSGFDMLSTEKLVDALGRALDEFGENGNQSTHPGLVRRAGFLRIGPMPYATSSAVVVSEWVDMQTNGYDLAYQIDNASHVGILRTVVVNTMIDDETAHSLLHNIVPGLDQTSHESFATPDNGNIVMSLLDPIAYEKLLAQKQQLSWRERREAQKQLERQYQGNIVSSDLASHLARQAIKRRTK